jgi:hypothetical protein
MTPERRREIKDLYQVARDRGPGVLANADPALRREVEAMLEQGEALPAIAGKLTERYEIQAQLGAGGMGGSSWKARRWPRG